MTGVYKRREDMERHKEGPWEDGGGDWSHAAINQGTPALLEAGKVNEGYSPRNFRESKTKLTPWLWTSEL